MTREEFRQKLDTLCAEAFGAGLDQLDVSLTLQEAYEEIDADLVIVPTPKFFDQMNN